MMSCLIIPDTAGLFASSIVLGITFGCFNFFGITFGSSDFVGINFGPSNFLLGTVPSRNVLNTYMQGAGKSALKKKLIRFAASCSCSFLTESYFCPAVVKVALFYLLSSLV